MLFTQRLELGVIEAMAKKRKYPDGVPGPSQAASSALMGWSAAEPLINVEGVGYLSPWGRGYRHFAEQALKPDAWDTGGENMEYLRQHCYWIIQHKNPDKLKQEAQAILDWIHGNWVRVCAEVYNRRAQAN